MQFNTTEEEDKTFKEWKKEHNKTCPFYDGVSTDIPKMGAIGGRFSFIFTPTSLGELFKVRCACGAEECFTDVSNW